jgi:hypothetical protein
VNRGVIPGHPGIFFGQEVPQDEGLPAMTALMRLPKAVWRRTRQVFVLIRDDGDVREIYGDNPNGIPEDERLLNAGMTSNIAMTSGGM